MAKLLICLLAVLALAPVWADTEGNVQKMRTLDVTDFGAIPNDGNDDTQAVLAALQECKDGSATTIIFPKGRYDFVAANGSPCIFPMQNYNNITVDGQGSEFVVDGWTGFFLCTDNKGLVFKNFTLDWKRVPFSIGRVIASEDRYFDVDVFEDYPIKGGEAIGAFMDFDPKTRLPEHKGLDEYNTVQSTELLRPQVLRVNLTHQSRIKPDSLVVLRHVVYGHNAFALVNCDDTKMQNINIYTAPGMAVVGKYCENISFDGVKVVPKPGTDRLMSSTADAFHIGGCTGVVSIKNCEFEGMGDDAANIKSGLYLTLQEKLDERTIKARHNLGIYDPPDPGHVMEIMHHNVMVPYATATVVSQEALENGAHKIVFKESLPEELKVGDLFGNATRTPKVRISNCCVRANRARGFLLQTRDVVVEGCKFENCTSGGVWVVTEVTFFFESIGSQDVVVRNCVFENCNYGGPLGPAVLAAYAHLKDFAWPEYPGIHKDILFENNIIRTADNAGILLAGVDGAILRGNVVEQASKEPTCDQGKAAIYVMSSKNIRIENNTALAEKQGLGLQSPLIIGKNVDESTLEVIDNKGF